MFRKKLHAFSSAIQEAEHPGGTENKFLNACSKLEKYPQYREATSVSYGLFPSSSRGDDPVAPSSFCFIKRKIGLFHQLLRRLDRV